MLKETADLSAVSFKEGPADSETGSTSIAGHVYQKFLVNRKTGPAASRRRDRISGGGRHACTAACFEVRLTTRFADCVAAVGCTPAHSAESECCVGRAFLWKSKKEQAVIAHDSFVDVVSGPDERLKKKLGFQPDFRILVIILVGNW